MKHATVVPIFKNGDSTNPSNYRPISLLPLFSKILERALYNRLTNYIQSNSLLSPQQFGFCRGVSTENAVSAFCERVYNALNNKLFTINVFVDLRKAFDTILPQI